MKIWLRKTPEALICAADMARAANGSGRCGVLDLDPHALTSADHQRPVSDQLDPLVAGNVPERVESPRFALEHRVLDLDPAVRADAHVAAQRQAFVHPRDGARGEALAVGARRKRLEPPVGRLRIGPAPGFGAGDVGHIVGPRGAHVDAHRIVGLVIVHS